MFILIFALSLAFVIALHEFGHFITAKAFGMQVTKFFIGFGPTLWSFRRGETEYGVKALPAGGFVKITGMNQAEEVDPAAGSRTFRDKPAWQRVIVLSAGSFTHFLVAWLLLFLGLAFVGHPNFDVPQTTVLDLVLDGSPAAAAGLQVGDRVVAVDGEPVTNFDQVRSRLEDRGGETVSLTIDRGGRRLTVTPTMATEFPDGERGAFLGVSPQPVTKRYSFGEALGQSLAGDLSVPRMTTLTVSGLAEVFRPSALLEWFRTIDDPQRDPTGPISPVGAATAVNTAGQTGNLFVVFVILANLNVVFGLMNMLPLPPLDGGHVAVLLVEQGVNRVRRLRGRPASWHLDPAVITPVALLVIAFFVVVSLTALYADIVNPVDLLGGS